VENAGSTGWERAHEIRRRLREHFGSPGDEAAAHVAARHANHLVLLLWIVIALGWQAWRHGFGAAMDTLLHPATAAVLCLASIVQTRFVQVLAHLSLTRQLAECVVDQIEEVNDRAAVLGVLSQKLHDGA
jgi:hypothetical protein